MALEEIIEVYQSLNENMRQSVYKDMSMILRRLLFNMTHDDPSITIISLKFMSLLVIDHPNSFAMELHNLFPKLLVIISSSLSTFYNTILFKISALMIHSTYLKLLN